MSTILTVLAAVPVAFLAWEIIDRGCAALERRMAAGGQSTEGEDSK